MAGWGAQQSGPAVLEVRFAGDVDSAMATALKKMQRDGLLDFLVR